MEAQAATVHKKHKSKIIPIAILLIVIGALAVILPLAVQQVNYYNAARSVALLEENINIPMESAYKPVDYSTMKQGETPTYSADELMEAGTPPGFLEELGIGGFLNLPTLGIATAQAEEVGGEPESMRQAMEWAAKALDEYKLKSSQNAEREALAKARQQLENAFFYLSSVRPLADGEVLANTQGDKASAALDRGDKIISAAYAFVFDMFTEIEGMLSQADALEAEMSGYGRNTIARGATQRKLTSYMDTLSHYFANAALHLPADDYRSAMAQHLALVQEELGMENVEVTLDPEKDALGRSYILEIPSLNLKVTCYRTSSFNAMYRNMKNGAAMFPRAPEPDTIGNICISAHRTGTRDYFRNLDKLKAGDIIYLHTSHMGSFKYEVTGAPYVIERDDWSVTSATDYPALTLLSCEAYQGISNGRRIVVRAKLIERAE